MINSNDQIPNWRKIPASVLQISQPISFLFIFLAYSLGASLADYLGWKMSIINLVCGMATCIFLFFASILFTSYFDDPIDLKENSKNRKNHEEYRVFILQLGFASFTLAVIFILILVYEHSLNIPAGILLVIMVTLLVFNAIPPFSLTKKGYGEIVQAIFLGTLIPGLGFLLNSGNYHRLLSLITFPQTLLALAWLLIIDFPRYAKDLKYERNTLLTKLTWQIAIPMHHFLIFSAFLFYALAPLFGIPWGLVWPVFLVLPFALVEVIFLQRIAQGGGTTWKLLSFLATATFGLSTYVLLYNFLTR